MSATRPIRGVTQETAGVVAVYCIRDDGLARVKVGHSRSPARRIRQLQTGSAAPLRLVGQFDGGKYVERSFHQTFWHRRIVVNGRVTEWIDDSDGSVSDNFLRLADGWRPGNILVAKRVPA